MLHIFCEKTSLADDILTISGESAHHIRNVLRMKAGEEVSVSFGDGKEYRFGIENFTDEAVLCRLRFVKEADVELPVHVTLYQALPKADKMDLIVQKTVELGVAAVVPVETARCITKLSEEKGKKRQLRWQAIAESAAEQSRRACIPQVGAVMSFAEACKKAEREADLLLFAYELEQGEGTARTLAGIKPGQRIAIFIGPEGGFTKEEAAQATEHGFARITLGKRILRTETAGLAFMAFLIDRLELTE